MKTEFSHIEDESLQPGSRVVVFKDHDVSGATIGYHGTIVRLHTASLRRHPDQPERWVYEVNVPAIQGSIDAHAADIYAPEESLPSTVQASESSPAKEHYCEIRLHGIVGTDNRSIRGAFRRPGQFWRLFTFTKDDVQRASYQLTHCMPPHSSSISRLEYRIPQEEQLDRLYVQRAIAQIVGGQVRRASEMP